MPFLDHKDSRRREVGEFENTEKVDQALKQSFLYNFLEWARAYIGVDSQSMLDFINQLSSIQWMGIVQCTHSIGYRVSSYTSCMLFFSFFSFLSKTKKNILKKENIQEKEKKQEKDERSFPQKQKPNKTENTQLQKTKYKEKPQHSQTFEMQTAVQLSCKTLRGTPLKAAVQEAQREEQKRSKSHNISSVLPLSSKILLFLSYHTIHNKVRQAIRQSVLPLKRISQTSKCNNHHVLNTPWWNLIQPY